MIANPRQWAALYKRVGIHRDLPRANGPVRTCARCEQQQPIESFRMNGIYRSSYCKACTLQVTEEWRSRKRDELNVRRRAAYAARKEGRTHMSRGPDWFADVPRWRCRP